MAKINKNANLYDKEGNLLRKAPLKDVTIEELEQMIDNFTGDKNSPEYANLIYSLTDLYRKYGNPHENELLAALKAAKTKEDKESIINSLNELNNELGDKENDERGVLSDDEEQPSQSVEDSTTEPNNVPSYNTDTIEEEYIEPISE